MNIKITKLTFRIGEREIELTLDEATELHRQIELVLPRRTEGVHPVKYERDTETWPQLAPPWVPTAIGPYNSSLPMACGVTSQMYERIVAPQGPPEKPVCI